MGARLHGDRARAGLERLPPALDRADGGGEPNVFRRDGEVWNLAYACRRAQLRDAKGLRDLAVLLAVPGREVAATELVAGVHGGAATAIAALGADPVLDDRARAAYRARLADLDDELAQADAHHDIGRSARLAAERDALIDELARATGLGGRRRRLGDATERARTTVTARIRDAIGRIERAHRRARPAPAGQHRDGCAVCLPAGRDRAVERLTIVRRDLTPSGQSREQRKETLMALDEQKVEQAAGKVFGELGVAVTGPLVVLGDRLGLWAAMAGAGPVTPNEPAARSGTVERYVREWLRGVAVAGDVGYDPAGGTFTLSDEMALVTAGEDSPRRSSACSKGSPGCGTTWPRSRGSSGPAAGWDGVTTIPRSTTPRPASPARCTRRRWSTGGSPPWTG